MRNLFVINVFFFFIGIFNLNEALYATSQKMIIIVPVADVRHESCAVPENLQGPALSGDIGPQETQLLFGECILAEEVPDKPEWLKIYALEQKIYTQDGKKKLYPGFIKKSCASSVSGFPLYNLITKELCVPIYGQPEQKHPSVCKTPVVYLGTKLCGKKHNQEWWEVTLPDKNVGYVESKQVYEIREQLPEDYNQLRYLIVQTAKKCLGCPYVWGGRSYGGKGQEHFLMGLDCSGLTNLAYRVAGLQIPRNSHDQYLASQFVSSGSLLKLGDLIFLARQKPQGLRVYHVMLYVGDGMLLEATGNPDGKNVSKIADAVNPNLFETRLISVQDYFGKSLDDIGNNESIESGHRQGNLIFLGTYFDSETKVRSLRSEALGHDLLVA